jgi:TonB-linked SusC/RagA family outer membrane protein
MKKLLLLIVLCTGLISFAHAQKQVTGKVTDVKDGTPLSGASVKIKGTSKGTLTDANGEFRISVSGNDVLVVSSVGYSDREVPVGDQTSLNITLTQGENVMNEVVVTALGIRRSKNQLPYSAQQVSGAEISKTRDDNFLSSLSGKVSGLEIRQGNTLGGSTNVVLRGFKSLTGNNQALFVVDGIPFDNSNTNTNNQLTGRGGFDYGNAAADINPDDIESINVLKGAAATALYGSRAANGVIVITTKKGRKGLGITINSGVIVGKIDKSTFPTYQKSYGAGYISIEYGGYGSPDGGFFYFDVNGDGQPDLVTPTTEDASWGAKFDPSLQVYQWDAFDKTSPYYHKPRPWVAAANDPSEFFETAVSYNNSVLLQGGGDKASFKLGYTRNNDNGILPNSQVGKDLLNFSSTYNITDRLSAGVNFNYSKIKGFGRYGNGYGPNNLMSNFRQWWEMNVDIKEQKDAYFRTRQNITWNWVDPSDEENGLKPIFWDNPYWGRYENYENDRRDRYFGNVMLNYKVTDWLNVMGRITLDSYDEQQEERVAVGSIGQFINGQLTTDPNGEPSGYSKFNRSFRETNYDLLINFDKNVSDNLNIKALLGGNIRQTNISSNQAKTNGGLVVPRFYALSNSLNQVSPTVEALTQVEVDGVFAGATLSYKDMLVLDGTIRRDRSSTLPEANNTYYYPSVSGGFIFSKLLPNATWLNYGKVRANYAEVGNSAPALSVHDTYVHDNNDVSFGTATLFSVPSTKNNENLKPERTKSTEAGLEVSMFKSRLGADITLYNTKSVDQILPVGVSTATGYNYEFVNAGVIRNRGIEISLNGTPVKTKDFSWNITVNWSKNQSRVMSLYDTSKNLLITSFQGDVTLNAAVGEPYGTLRGSNFVYLNGQKVVGDDGFYKFAPTANEIIGNINPDWIGGISNTFKYKNLALSFLIDVRQGGDVFSLDMYYGLATGLYPETAGLNDKGQPVRNTLDNGGGVIFPGVTADGKPNTNRVDISGLYGAYGYVNNPSAAFVYDASFVKLREASLTYSFSDRLIKKINPIKGIDLSLVGRNLWIIHKNLPYADPEETTSSGNIQGLQTGAYPSVRSVGFNVTVKF